jgi:hypothetical protein
MRYLALSRLGAPCFVLLACGTRTGLEADDTAGVDDGAALADGGAYRSGMLPSDYPCSFSTGCTGVPFDAHRVGDCELGGFSDPIDPDRPVVVLHWTEEPVPLHRVASEASCGDGPALSFYLRSKSSIDSIRVVFCSATCDALQTAFDTDGRVALGYNTSTCSGGSSSGCWMDGGGQ